MRAAILSAALLAAAPAAAEYERGDCLDSNEAAEFQETFGETNVVLLHVDPNDPDVEDPDYLGMMVLTRPDGATWTILMNFDNKLYCVLDFGVNAEFPDVIVRGRGVKS